MADIFRDIPYASQSAAQKLDIYLPEGGKRPYPVIVWLHPGGFTMGSKDMIKPFSSVIAQRGYAAVSAGYRLADEAQFPAQIYDAKAAVRWVRANAAKHQFNPNKMAAWGISAGATLAALLGTSEKVDDLEDLDMGNSNESSRIDAVIDWYGPTDFVLLDSQRKETGQQPGEITVESGESIFLGGRLTEVPEKYQAASAITYVSSKCPPFYIQHGTADEIIPCLQSVLFAKALEEVIGKDKVELRLIENAGHFDRIHSANENVKASLDFLDSHLG